MVHVLEQEINDETEKETTMVLAVDYQEKLMPAMHNKDAFIPRTCLLLKGLKALDIPMIASEQYPKGLGSTVPEIKEVLGTVPYLQRPHQLHG